MPYQTYLIFTIPKQISSKHVNYHTSVNNQDSGGVFGYELVLINGISTEEVPILSLNFETNLTLTIIMIISLSIGTFCKCIMYRYSVSATKQNHEWMHRPINVLTLASAITHHVTHLWSGLFFIASFIAETPLERIMGHNFCEISYWIGLYGFMYLTVGSLGIAILRVLYIKTNTFVKDAIGEKQILVCILLMSVIGCGTLATLFSYETTNQRTFLQTCRGLSPTHVQVLLDYSLSLGNEHDTTNFLRKVVVLLLIGFQIVEFIICAWFFYFQYKHNNGNIKKLLDQEVIRDRNLKNITTFIGHIYGFLTEYAYLLLSLVCLFIVGENMVHYQAIANIVKVADFGLLSVVEILSSPTLRRFIKI